VTAVVIPAHNEADTIALTLLATDTQSVSDRVVVADNCTDLTASVARALGARVIEITAGDKGSAMAAGVAAVADDLVLFLDADLRGLRPVHVEALATFAPLDGMVVGLRDGAKSSGLPPISGERRLPTKFAKKLKLAGLGYRAELAIDAAVAKAGLAHRHYAMKGVTNPTREARHPLMYADLAFYALVHLPALALYTEQSVRSTAC
jgi:glycosyltransferase involved in cell wall biosynthesis